MNWECNRCGYRVQPVKEVEPDGMSWPAGRACSRCQGEMVYRPILKVERLNTKNFLKKFPEWWRKI